jgi:hypothetical protein
MISKESVEDFFNQYSSTMNNALFGEQYELNTIMNSFSDFVVGASPVGVAGGKNDEQFAKAMLGGIDFYKKIGIISMNIISKEVNILDEVHAVVKIVWNCFYGNENGSGEIPFEVVYMVQYRDGVNKIFAYVTGDEKATFRHHKLIPEIAEHGEQD